MRDERSNRNTTTFERISKAMSKPMTRKLTYGDLAERNSQPLKP